MPTRRKEVRFFDRHYEQGLEWYGTFFCSPEERNRYLAVGEISPQYYLCEQCPARIFETLPEVKLVAMLRHPVDRAYSHYGFCVQRRNYRGTFQDFLHSRPQALEKGFYSRYLKYYFQYFDKSQMLVLLFEDVFSDIESARKKLAEVLDISTEKFGSVTTSTRVNRSSVPRFPALSRVGITTGRRLRRWQLEPAVDLARRIGIQRVLASGNPLPALDGKVRTELSRLYQDEFDDLEACLETDLTCWRE
jgi:sulfotransferase family protein